MRVRLFLIVCLFGISSRCIDAAEPILDFSRSLREYGLGDMAVEYIQQVSQRSDVPADVREVLELELSSGYRLWAQQTSNSELSEQRMAEAKRLFDKFSAAHPEHHAAAFALMDWGDSAMARGERIFNRVEHVQDEGMRAKYMSEARAAFNDARPDYEQAAERFRKQLTSLTISSALPIKEPADNDATDKNATKKDSGGKNASKKNAPAPVDPVEQMRQRTELGMIEAKLKLAGLDFYTSQTYRNANTKERSDALKRAKEGFQWIYQKCGNSVVGLRAQMWEARITEELGNEAEAFDLFDEVLASDTIGISATSDLASLFAETALWRIRLTHKKDGPEMAGEEATEWLRAHQSWKNIPHYQGIALEAAKAMFWKATKVPPNQRSKLNQDAMVLLSGILKVPSEYAEEALALRRKHLGEESKPTASTFAEKVALADLAAESGRWVEAMEGYTEALKAPQDAADARLVNTARNRLSLASYRVAVSHYSAGKYEEAIQLGGAIAKNDPSDPYAPLASSVACFAALSLYSSSPENARSAAAERVQKIADYTIKTWPGQPAADDALVILGQLNAEQGNTDRAVGYFERVTKSSSRFPLAMVAAGRLYWNLYLAERRKPESDRDAKVLDQLRDKAEQYLRAGATEENSAAADEKSEQAQVESRVLLAEIYLDTQRAKEAITLVEPTISRYLAAGEKGELDTVTARALVAGLRAYCVTKQIDRASNAAMEVARSAPDMMYVNSVLVDVVRAMRADIEPPPTAADGKNESDVKPIVGAAPPPSGVRQQLEKLLTAMVDRKHYSTQGLAYIADSCRLLGMHEAARNACERVLSKVDPKTASASDKQVLTRVRFQLVELLSAENRHSEAAKYLDELLVDHPRSLELMMQKGKLLLGCARDDASRYEECVAHWTKVRLMLTRLQPRPKEYYDAVYNAAVALYEQAYKSKDNSKARQAEQVLKSTMTLEPNLNGKETVDKFNVLLEQVVNLQARRPIEPAAPAKPAPTKATPTKPAGPKSTGPKSTVSKPNSPSQPKNPSKK